MEWPWCIHAMMLCTWHLARVVRYTCLFCAILDTIQSATLQWIGFSWDFFAQNSLRACAILNMSLVQCTLLRRRTTSKRFPNKVMWFCDLVRSSLPQDFWGGKIDYIEANSRDLPSETNYIALHQDMVQCSFDMPISEALVRLISISFAGRIRNQLLTVCYSFELFLNMWDAESQNLVSSEARADSQRMSASLSESVNRFTRTGQLHPVLSL